MKVLEINCLLFFSLPNLPSHQFVPTGNNLNSIIEDFKCRIYRYTVILQTY